MKLKELQKELKKSKQEGPVAHFMEASSSLADMGDVIMGGLRPVKKDAAFKQKMAENIKPGLAKTITALFKIANFYGIELEEAVKTCLNYDLKSE